MLIPDGNFLPFGCRSDHYITMVKAPIMIIHGTKDETVSIHSARKLASFLKKDDQFIEVPGGKHKTLDKFSEYHAAIDSLFE